MAQTSDDSVQILKKCPQCNYWEKQPDAQFCSQCGHALILTRAIVIQRCPKENRTLESNARFCPFCGTPAQTMYQEIPSATPKPGTSTSGDDPYATAPAKPRTASDPKPVAEPPRRPVQDAPKPLDAGQSVITSESWVQDARMLEQQVAAEGLRITAEQRQITRSLWEHPSSLEDVEAWYRMKIAQRYPNPKISIIRMNDPICQSPVLIMKFQAPKQEMAIEVMFYAYAPSLLQREKQVQKVLDEKMQIELRPSQTISKEIAALEKLVQEGQSTPDLELRMQELIRRRDVCLNSSTYWQLKARQTMLQQKINVLFLTLTQKKAGQEH